MFPSSSTNSSSIASWLSIVKYGSPSLSPKTTSESSRPMPSLSLVSIVTRSTSSNVVFKTLVVELKLLTTPVWPLLARVFVTPNVPDTSFKTKFAVNCPSGASVYLNPWLIILTLSTAPISFVSAVRSVLVPEVDVTVTEGNNVYPSPPSFMNTLVISPVETVPSSKANVSLSVP